MLKLKIFIEKQQAQLSRTVLFIKYVKDLLQLLFVNHNIIFC